MERVADRLTDTLVDAAFGAYAAKCAHYEHGAHLLTFGDDGAEMISAATRDSDPSPMDEKRSEGKTNAFFSSGSVFRSALFGLPLETLERRLNGLRRALDIPGEHHAGKRTNAAIRTVAKLAARRLLQNVVLATRFFSPLGAARFAADVSALLAVFTAASFARRPGAFLVESTEASALLNLDVREAARVATACGAAEAAAAAARESEREANDADEKGKG